MLTIAYILADILEIIGIGAFVCFVFFILIAIGG